MLRGITPVPKTCQNGHQHLKFYPFVPEMPLFGHGVSGIEDVAVDEALRHPSRAVMLLIYSAFLKTNRRNKTICFQENIDSQQIGCPGKICSTGLQREIRSTADKSTALARKDLQQRR